MEIFKFFTSFIESCLMYFSSCQTSHLSDFFFFFFGIVSLLCIYCNCFGKANYRGQGYEVMRERIIINEVIELNSVYSSYSFFFFNFFFFFIILAMGLVSSLQFEELVKY